MLRSAFYRSILSAWLLVIAAVSLPVCAQSLDLTVIFDEVTDSAVELQRNALIDSGIAEGLNEVLRDELELEQPLSLRFVSETDPAKYLTFDDASGEIRLAYQFRLAITNRFDEKIPKLQGKMLQHRVNAVVEMALYHEVAHALASSFNFSGVGQESALNELAVLLLIEGHEAETRIDLRALKQFGLIAIDYEKGSASDFWQAHTLNFERFSTGICIIVGSDPERYELPADKVGFDNTKISSCVDDYGVVLARWLENLYDFLKKGGNFIRL